MQYRRISQMTYEPKSSSKTADFKTFTLCISLNSSQIYTYFCTELVIGYCMYLVKNSIPNSQPFLN